MSDYTMMKIYDSPAKINEDVYNFIIYEKWVPGWGRQFAVGRRRPKFYEIKKNGKTILSTTLHQTWHAEQRKIKEGR